MNIAFFTNNYKPFIGGVPIAIENCATSLRRRGHRVFIFAPEYEEKIEDEQDVIRTTSLKNFNDTPFSLPLPLSLEPYVRFSELNVDLVHVHHPFLLGQTGLHAARGLGVPVVFTYHTQYEKYAHYLPFGEKMVGEIAINVATRFCNCCDVIVAPSTDVQKMLEQRGVTAPIRVIPTGVDLSRFRAGSRTRFRERYGIPQRAKVMLFVSRLAKEKNVGLLLDAFARVSKEMKDVWLVLVGGGDDEESLRERASQLPAADRVIFTGSLSGRDLVSAYKGSDLFVFASTTETQGMVVLEAMAGGLPVVAVDAPGVRDVVTHGRDGFLCDEADEFAALCMRVLKDDELSGRLREGAAVRARQLSLTRTTRKLEDAYRYVIQNPRPAREERFVILEELLRYQFDRFAQGLGAIMP